MIKKLIRISIAFVIIMLLLAGNYICGYYMGYNVKNTNFFDKVISPDNRYAIEIQAQDNGFIGADLIIVCEDLTTHKKVDYMIIYIGMFSSGTNFEDIVNLKWYDDMAELTVWAEENVITTYILDWDTIFSS